MKITDNIKPEIRYAILSEILENPTTDERDLISQHAAIISEDDEAIEKREREIGRMIAEMKNNPAMKSGVVGKKLI